MDAGSGVVGRAVSEINVTPLIDVLLVVLIIFMVTQPVAQAGLDSQIPQPSKSSQPSPDSVLVVQVSSGETGEATYTINQTSFAKDALGEELRALMATRSDRTIFVQGDRDLTYRAVAEVVDLGHKAGAQTVALMPLGAHEK